jgi:hypothetical protein
MRCAVPPEAGCFAGVKTVGCEHEVIVTGGGHASVENAALTWLNAMIGNIRNSIQGTYHGIGESHVPRYLAELCYRFNRCFKLPEMIPRLGQIATRIPLMPERLLRLVEISW